jgi:hypothetical protein
LNRFSRKALANTGTGEKLMAANISPQKKSGGSFKNRRRPRREMRAPPGAI